MIATEILEEQTTIEWLPVNEIGIDKKYQRTRSEKKIKEITAKFNKNAVGILMVSERTSGQHYVMDGQHRLEALKKLGISLAECKVIRGLTQSQEAGIFINCNENTKKPEALDLFRAREVQNDPTVLAIQVVVEKCGLYIQFHPEGGHPGRKRPPTFVWCVQALEEIYKRGKEELLEEVLMLAKRTWPDDGDAFQSKVLLGIMHFHLKYQGLYLREDFISKIGLKDLRALLRRAQYHSENGGGSMPRTFARALLETYNSGRRTRRLSEDK